MQWGFLKNRTHNQQRRRSSDFSRNTLWAVANWPVAGTTRGKWYFQQTTVSALADVLYIFPLKADKKTFDANKEELGFASKPKIAKKVKTAAELEIERVQKLKEEEDQIRGEEILC